MPLYWFSHHILHSKCRKRWCGRCFRACVTGGGGDNLGVIFCYQILLIRYAIYFGRSVDLGVPLISSAPRETRFPALQVPFASVRPLFAGAFASIFTAFPTCTSVLSLHWRCRCCCFCCWWRCSCCCSSCYYDGLRSLLLLTSLLLLRCCCYCCCCCC